jgi:hypothetical protein
MGLMPMGQDQEDDENQEYGQEAGSPGMANINAGAMVIEGEDNESEQIHGGGQNIGDDEPIDFQENIQVQNQEQYPGQLEVIQQLDKDGNLINVNTQNAQIN